MESSALIGFWVSLAQQYRLNAQQQIYGSGFQRFGRWSLYYVRAERPPFLHYLLVDRFYHRQAFNYDFNFGARPKINQISLERCSADVIKCGDIRVPTKSCFWRDCIFARKVANDMEPLIKETIYRRAAFCAIFSLLATSTPARFTACVRKLLSSSGLLCWCGAWLRGLGQRKAACARSGGEKNWNRHVFLKAFVVAEHFNYGTDVDLQTAGTDTAWFANFIFLLKNRPHKWNRRKTKNNQQALHIWLHIVLTSYISFNHLDTVSS